MLKHIPSTRLLRALRASIEGTELLCSSYKPLKARTATQWRSTTRIASTTSVNAQKDIPEEYKELYDRLNVFGKTAAVYVNISQLQLALRNLETRDSTIRIAVLGVNDQTGPLQLVRTLLADPLTPEAQWEQELQRTIGDGKPLLVRAGLKVSLELSHPLLRTLTIPSTILEQNKIELLLHQVFLEEGRSIEPTEEVLSSLLSPSLHAQQSFSGRTTSVTYPVHKTILLEDGFGSLLSLAGLLQSREGCTASKMVEIVTNVTWPAVPDSQSRIFFVNTKQALHAIKTFRESLENSLTYEREWLSSGLPSLTSVVLPDSSTSAPLNSMTRNLIKHILDETELLVSVAESESARKSLSLTVPDASRQQLQTDITAWAEDAHTEFRLSLANILNSRAWRKLAWWKLLWRIDDVEMITSEAIRRAYMVEAETNIMFIAGKISQAGLLDTVDLKERQTKDDSQELDYDDAGAELVRQENSQVVDSPHARLLGIVSKNLILDQQPPWSIQIALSRSSILQETIPPLTASAQRYLLSALSVTGLTSLTSALTYFSMSTSLYEAGTIAAIGIVLSAYQLQRKWEFARQSWVTGVEVEGKHTLNMVEKMARLAVRTGGQEKPDEAGIRTREDIRAAILHVRHSLAKLEAEPVSR